LKDTNDGPTLLTAAAGGFTSGTQNANINAAGATRLGFSTGAKSLTAGSCSTAVTVQSQDPYGNAATLGGATAIALSSSSGANTTFFSDAGCTLAVGSVTISAGGSSVSYYFK